MTLEDGTGGSKVTELLRNSFGNLNKNIFEFFEKQQEIKSLKNQKKVYTQRVNRNSAVNITKWE